MRPGLNGIYNRLRPHADVGYEFEKDGTFLELRNDGNCGCLDVLSTHETDVSHAIMDAHIRPDDLMTRGIIGTWNKIEGHQGVTTQGVFEIVDAIEEAITHAENK